MTVFCARKLAFIFLVGQLAACASPTLPNTSAGDNSSKATLPASASLSNESPSKPSVSNDLPASSTPQSQNNVAQPEAPTPEQVFLSLSYPQQINQISQQLNIQGVGQTLNQTFFLKLSGDSLQQKLADNPPQTTQELDELLDSLGQATKKSIEVSTETAISAFKNALAQLAKLEPPEDQVEKQNQYKTYLSESLKLFEALKAVLGPLTIKIGNTDFQKEVFEPARVQSGVDNEALAALSQQASEFTESHWSTARRQLLSEVPKRVSYSALAYDPFYREQLQDLHLLIKDVSIFFTNQPDASVLSQKENLLLEKTQIVSNVIPRSEKEKAHYRLYDWAVSSHILIQEIKRYAAENQNTAAVFNATTAAQDKALNEALSGWLYYYVQANGAAPEFLKSED